MGIMCTRYVRLLNRMFLTICICQMEEQILYVRERVLIIEKCSGIVTSSKTSASLLRTSSGSDWKEGTLGAEIRVRDVSHSHVVRA